MKATNGMDALQIIGEHTIDLAILDIMMPGMDGLQLLKSIRRAYHFPSCSYRPKASIMTKFSVWS